jgi:hypothetical protein
MKRLYQRWKQKTRGLKNAVIFTVARPLLPFTLNVFLCIICYAYYVKGQTFDLSLLNILKESNDKFSSECTFDRRSNALQN